MICHTIGARLEEVASGEAGWSHEEETHVSACARCQARLARARDIARVLPTLAVEPAPASFTADVMARVRRERWRAEQALDVGFNVAVAAGLCLVISGVAGLAWASGLIVVGADVVGLMRDGLSLASTQVAPQLPFYITAALLLTLGLGVWWWTEGADAHW
jgi:hypothetical protein